MARVLLFAVVATLSLASLLAAGGPIEREPKDILVNFRANYRVRVCSDWRDEVFGCAVVESGIVRYRGDVQQVRYEPSQLTSSNDFERPDNDAPVLPAGELVRIETSTRKTFISLETSPATCRNEWHSTGFKSFSPLPADVSWLGTATNLGTINDVWGYNATIFPNSFCEMLRQELWWIAPVRQPDASTSRQLTRYELREDLRSYAIDFTSVVADAETDVTVPPPAAVQPCALAAEVCNKPLDLIVMFTVGAAENLNSVRDSLREFIAQFVLADSERAATGVRIGLVQYGGLDVARLESALTADAALLERDIAALTPLQDLMVEVNWGAGIETAFNQLFGDGRTPDRAIGIQRAIYILHENCRPRCSPPEIAPAFADQQAERMRAFSPDTPVQVYSVLAGPDDAGLSSRLIALSSGSEFFLGRKDAGAGSPSEYRVDRVCDNSFKMENPIWTPVPSPIIEPNPPITEFPTPDHGLPPSDDLLTVITVECRQSLANFDEHEFRDTVAACVGVDADNNTHVWDVVQGSSPQTTVAYFSLFEPGPPLPTPAGAEPTPEVRDEIYFDRATDLDDAIERWFIRVVDNDACLGGKVVLSFLQGDPLTNGITPRPTPANPPTPVASPTSEPTPCVPDCRFYNNNAERECGTDGCGGSCGTCPQDMRCASGRCERCTCTGRQCGDDGCGRICGFCPIERACFAGFCELLLVTPEPTPQPNPNPTPAPTPVPTEPTPEPPPPSWELTPPPSCSNGRCSHPVFLDVDFDFEGMLPCPNGKCT